MVPTGLMAAPGAGAVGVRSDFHVRQGSDHVVAAHAPHHLDAGGAVEDEGEVALGLLVPCHEGQQPLRVGTGRQAGGEAEGGHDPAVVLDGGSVDPPQTPGEQRGEHEADGDRLAVAQPAVGSVPEGRRLEGVGQGVPVVEHGAAPAFALVLLDHGGLDGRAAQHLFLDGIAGPGRPQGRGHAHQRVLGHLAPPAGPLAPGQGGQDLGVAQHRPWLPERTDQVLALGQVDPRLAADGRVDLGQQGGGHVDVGRPPVEGGGGEPGQVGDHAPADGHDHVGPAEAGAGEGAAQPLHGGEGLGPLAVGHGQDLVGQPGIDAHADPLLGDHRGAAGPGHGGGQAGGQLVAGTGAHHHVVGPLAQGDRHGAGHGPTPAPVRAARARPTTASTSRSSTSTTASATAA